MTSVSAKVSIPGTQKTSRQAAKTEHLEFYKLAIVRKLIKLSFYHLAYHLTINLIVHPQNLNMDTQKDARLQAGDTCSKAHSFVVGSIP